MPETKSEDADVSSAPFDSIESLYAAHESSLLAYAQSLVKQNEAAQDIVQEAFMRLHADFDSVRQPQAWLYRTVHNLAVNQLRAGRKIVPLVAEESNQVELCDPKPLPDEYLAKMEAIGQTRLSLDVLD